ncbi:MAG: aconitase X catalytic domain-containing protein [Bacteroidota bacterium]|nr:aconitase X catalytic domain-containing protein [Bacteroidota bacterium]
MNLTPSDKADLHGERGKARQMAMRILVRMLPAFGGREFLDITAAHIDSSLFQGDATLEYAERLSNWEARVVVPTTLNVSGVDEHGWRQWAVPADWAEKSIRQMAAYKSMGCKPTWTCAPYQESVRPAMGQQVAWGESSAVIFINSVLGARTARYPDLLDICAAITGRAPAAGLHLAENRRGQLLYSLKNVPVGLQEDDSFYGVLGHFIGADAGMQVPVIEGFEVHLDEDNLKALGAAMASSGATALYHVIGVTPEAPTMDAAFDGMLPVRKVDVTMEKLRAARKELTTADGELLDIVALGSPHFSLGEFAALSSLVEGKRKCDRVKFLVTASRIVRALAKKAGYLEPITQFGGTVTVDTCILTSPMLPGSINTLMTNSAKYAYYAPGLLGTRVVFGSLEDCVRSAISGQIETDASLWDA